LRRLPVLTFVSCIAVLASVLLGATIAYPASVPELQVRTSWIGNTYGFGDGTWTQINITAIAAAPDGRVFTDSPWDESGAEASVYKDGKVLGYADGTHGWGNGGGNAVALNRRYVFIGMTVGNERGHLSKPGVWPPRGMQWYGVSRRAIDDPRRVAPFQADLAASDDLHARSRAGFLMVNETPPDTPQAIGGLAASDTSLYVANTALNRIEEYDAETMQQRGKWDAQQPGRIALAKDGTLWALIDSMGDAPRLAHYTAKGVVINDAPALARDTQAADLTIDGQGRLLIADNGPRQQVLIFTSGAGGYKETGALGERGGIFSGVAGKPGPQRFNGLTGVATDAAGNIYVSTNGSGVPHDTRGAALGATLESYAPDGHRLWQVQGLLFVDGAWMDPSRPNSVFTGNKRFELDLSKPPGQEWTYAGFLSGRFKYPEDPVFHVDQYPGLPMARKLDGRTFLYLTDMYSDHLKIYRFDPKRNGELATPSVYIAGSARGGIDKIPNHPAKGDWIWHDYNGNGSFEANEFEPNTSGMQFIGGWGWWVDTKGDIWRTTNAKGIYRLRYGGVDKVGNPIYSYANSTAYAMPAPFTELRRAVYDAASDTMYLTGYTADEPFDRAYWKEVGRRLVRFDHWSTKPQQRYSMELPWDTGSRPVATTLSMTVEGKYIFTVEPNATVHVFDNESGRELGVIKPGPEVGRASGFIDVPNAITAFRQADGEYLVFVEEDARGKVMMYRWKPS
jgi:hypothetical protein